MMRRANVHRALPVILLVAAGVIVASLIFLSPAVLASAAKSRPDWPDLAEVGEAYSGASAMLSSIALFGVAASLLLQRGLNRMTQLYSFKQQHVELVKLALDNPEFLYVDGTEFASDPEARRKVYANLIVSHWAMAWDLGMMSVPTLRANASRLLREMVARQWWEAWRFSYHTSRSRRRFVKILDEEYERAPPTPEEPLPRPHLAKASDGAQAPSPAGPAVLLRTAGGMVVAGVAGLAVGLAIAKGWQGKVERPPLRR